MGDALAWQPGDATGLPADDPSMPAALTDLWRRVGLGTSADGYLRVVAPSEGADLARIVGYDPAGPVAMTTALADLVVVEDEAVRLVVPRHGTHRIIATSLDRLLAYAGSSTFRDDPAMLDALRYPQAVERLGIPERDECLGYVPLLALGGHEDASHLQRMRMREHLAVIASLAGPVG